MAVEKCHFSFVGDFNYPDIDRVFLWLNGNQKITLDVFDEKNILQLVRRPTHIKGKILDVVATSNSNLQKMSVQDDPFSHYYPVNKTIFFENAQSTSKFSA